MYLLYVFECVFDHLMIFIENAMNGKRKCRRSFDSFLLFSSFIEVSIILFDVFNVSHPLIVSIHDGIYCLCIGVLVRCDCDLTNKR